jgi:hypothetical protein
VLKLRSVNNIVSPPAKTGTARINMTAVVREAQMNKTIWEARIPVRALTTVAVKLMEATIEDAPATWREKIPKSIEYEGEKSRRERGG